MLDSVSENKFENNLISDSDSVSNNISDNVITKYSCNENTSCNEIKSCNNKNFNKDSNLVTVPTIYLDFKEVFNEKNC